VQLPLDFGKPMTLRSAPLTASITFSAPTTTATLSVRRPGRRTRAIRQSQSSLSLATAIKLMTLQLLIEKTYEGWATGSHWTKAVYGFLKGLISQF
jgi:hypothetical protein